MNDFESSLNRYVLHDTVITSAMVNSGSLTFVFDDGVFFFEPSLCSFNHTCTCHMNILIKDFDIDRLYENIEIKTIVHGVVKDVSFDNLMTLIKKSGFRIYLDYYCFFAKSILLIGNTEDFEFEITVTDIEKIDFVFQNQK